MKRLTRLPILLSIFCELFGLSLNAASAQDSPFIYYQADKLTATKSNLANNSAAKVTVDAYEKLLSSADGYLKKPAPTVMNKKITPLSGNKHDYLSISRYWWPDPSKEDGLPWIRKDGKTNPSTQNDDVDRKRLGRMVKGVRVLSLAYYLSDDEKYARKASELMQVWFLNKETKMNPHLQYAQSVPGNPKGRRSGILDGRLIPLYILDGMTLIKDSEYWNAQLTEQMHKWFKIYLTWLTTSELGKKGALQENNHGSWYFFQVVALAHYLGETDLLTEQLAKVKHSFDHQFDKEGKQPHELKRTRSFFYSTFNLKPLGIIAHIAKQNGVDVWHHETEDGKSMQQAIGFLLNAIETGEWNYKTKKGIQPSMLIDTLYLYDLDNNSAKHKGLIQAQLQQKAPKDMKRFYQYLALFEPQLFAM